jgi:hypothetical protein
MVEPVLETRCIHCHGDIQVPPSTNGARLLRMMPYIISESIFLSSPFLHFMLAAKDRGDNELRVIREAWLDYKYD